MYVTHCPLRVSLFGGSTDNPYFVKKYGYGSVISFTCDLKTYVTCLLYTSPSPRDVEESRMPSSA